MDFSLFLLCLIQGITEAFPISSSGHLAFLTLFLKVDPTLFDTALHAGTLLAFMASFPGQVQQLLIGGYDIVCGKIHTLSAKKWIFLALATTPAILIGALLHIFHLRSASLFWMGFNSIVFGLFMGWADRYPGIFHPVTLGSETQGSQKWWHSLVLGVGQVFAFFPGASRMGTCLTAARCLGYSRPKAFETSFLMGIACVSSALVLKVKDIAAIGWKNFILTTLLSFVICFPLVKGVIAFSKKYSLIPFMLYRLGLGILILWALYKGWF